MVSDMAARASSDTRAVMSFACLRAEPESRLPFRQRPLSRWK